MLARITQTFVSCRCIFRRNACPFLLIASVLLVQPFGASAQESAIKGTQLSTVLKGASKRVFSPRVHCTIPAEYPTGLALSPNGKYAAVTTRVPGSSNGLVSVWSLDDQKVVRKIFTKGLAHAPIFTPDSEWIVAADGVGNLEYLSTFHAWHIESKREKKLGEIRGSVTDICFSSNENRLVAVSVMAFFGAVTPGRNWPGEILIADMKNPQANRTLQCELFPKSKDKNAGEPLLSPIHLATNSDGSRVALSITHSQPKIKVYDVKTMQRIQTLDGDGGAIRFSQSDQIDCANFQITSEGKQFSDPTKSARQPWFAQNGRAALSVLDSGEIRLRTLSGAKQITLLPAPKSKRFRMAIDANARFVAISDTRTVEVWQVTE